MTRRRRKIFGGMMMIAEVTVYPFFAMALADSRPVAEAPTILQVLCYAVLGLAWTLPLFPLIKWMEGGRAA